MDKKPKDKKWYVLYHSVRPSILIPALKNILGSENVWWPYYEEEGKKLSLFPGYVFVSIDPDSGIENKIKSEFHDVIGFLPLPFWTYRGIKKSKPVPLKDEEIQIIKFLESNQSRNLFKEEKLKIGDIVEISETKFIHIKGVVKEIGKEFAKVSITFFNGREVTLRLPIKCLIKIS